MTWGGRPLSPGEERTDGAELISAAASRSAEKSSALLSVPLLHLLSSPRSLSLSPASSLIPSFYPGFFFPFTEKNVCRTLSVSYTHTHTHTH